MNREKTKQALLDGFIAVDGNDNNVSMNDVISDAFWSGDDLAELFRVALLKPTPDTGETLAVMARTIANKSMNKILEEIKESWED